MKLNKIIISVTLLASGVMMTTSCNDYLDVQPESFIGPSDVEDSEEGANYWLSGVYSNWLDAMFRWDAFPRVLELDADYISGPDWLFGAMGAGNFQAEGNLDNMWSGLYNLINDANLAERNIAGMTNVSEAARNNAIGEIYFQKAFSYFLLVRAYGAVPYLETDVSNGNSFYEPRRPVAEIYEHIIDLLTQASEMMYRIDNPNYQYGHVCAGSAAGLLAKVYATMAAAAMPAGTEVTVQTGEPFETTTNANGDEVYIYKKPAAVTFQKRAVSGYESMNAQELYTKAGEWAKKVIDGEYGLYELSSYSQLWKKTNRYASEFMWAVESLDNSDVYRSGVHTFYSGYKKTAGSEFLESGGWVGCTYNWYSLFDEDDYRVADGVRHFWRYYYQEDYNGCFYYPQSWVVKLTGFDELGNWVQDPDPEYDNKYAWQHNINSSECLAFTTKYDDCTNDASNNTDSQWPFLRYADVLLIYAEAQNELGNSDEAMKYLNMVRARSNAHQMTQFLGQSALRSSILEERAKEFACEGDRRWDLIRWGIYLDVMNSIGRDDCNINKSRTERNLLYPIPDAEMNSNIAITENNPGWN